MQLSDLTAKLRRAVGDPSTTDVTDDELHDYINDAYLDICDRYKFHITRKLCSFDTVAGTSQYNLPDDIYNVISVRNTTNETRLRKVDQLYVAEAVGTATQGTPEKWTRFRNYMQLFPTPDAVYNIRVFYKCQVDRLTDDNEVPIIPESWHRGIRLLARHMYYDDRSFMPQANYALQIWSNWASTKTDEIADEEYWDNDKGVNVPELGTPNARLDFDHSD